MSKRLSTKTRQIEAKDSIQKKFGRSSGEVRKSSGGLGRLERGLEEVQEMFGKGQIGKRNQKRLN